MALGGVGLSLTVSSRGLDGVFGAAKRSEKSGTT